MEHLVEDAVPLANGGRVEALMLTDGRNIHLSAALIDGDSALIAGCRHIFVGLGCDLELFTSEFEQVIGFALPRRLFA
jgi:hypothetical protein